MKITAIVTAILAIIIAGIAGCSSPDNSEPVSYNRSVSEDIIISDKVTMTAKLYPKPSQQELLSISATVTVQVGRVRSVGENITISDSVTVTVQRGNPFLWRGK